MLVPGSPCSLGHMPMHLTCWRWCLVHTSIFSSPSLVLIMLSDYSESGFTELWLCRHPSYRRLTLHTYPLHAKMTFLIDVATGSISYRVLKLYNQGAMMTRYSALVAVKTILLLLECVIPSLIVKCVFVFPGLGLPPFWGPHGRWVDPAALSAWGVSGRTHHPQHHVSLHQLHQVMTPRQNIWTKLICVGSVQVLPASPSWSCLSLRSRALDNITEGDSTVAGYVEEVLQTLNDLIEYFKQPDSELEHEEKQCLLRSLIKRQDLFKEEVRVDTVEASSSCWFLSCYVKII